MALKIVQPPAEPKPNILLYGPPKTGKTAGAASAPGRKLLLNADTRNATRFAHQRAADLTEAEVEGLQTLIDVTHIVQAEDCAFDTVILDPINDVYRRLVEDLSRRALRPSLPTYGDATVHLERFCRMLCEAPVNVVLVAHELKVGDGDDIKWFPFTGSSSNPTLGQKIAGMVDVVGYTGVVHPEDGGDPIYAAQLLEQNGRLGGDRFAAIAPGMGWAPMDLGEWFARINGQGATPKAETDQGAKPEKEAAAA